MKVIEIYAADKNTISEFLENNALPAAVKEALTLRLATLSEYVELLSESEDER